MIELSHLEGDSRALLIPAYEARGVESEADLREVWEQIAPVKSCYVSLKLSPEHLGITHLAESLGFRFVEVQYETSLRLREPTEQISLRYKYLQVQTSSELNEVLEMASNAIVNDRISTDPLLGASHAGRRYRNYLSNSFSRSDEEIWCVRDTVDGSALTFRSHRRVNSREALLLLGGVRPDLNGLGLGLVSSQFCFRQLWEGGYSVARTSISATNLPIVALEVGHLGFRIRRAKIVLRFLRP